MVELIWDPIVATAAILLCSLAAYCLLRAARRNTKQAPNPEKAKTYCCGEELKPEDMHADSGQFFSPVRRVLSPFYRYIQTAHTGELSTYLTWLVTALVIILIAIMLLVR